MPENLLSKIRSGYNKYIVRPFLDFGLAGFVFDVEGDVSIEQKADITDHYIEDNSAIQDHMAVRPISVKLTNYIGEVAGQRKNEVATTTADVIQKLSILNEYLPEVTGAVSQLRNNIDNGFSSFDDAVDDTSDIWRLVKDLNPTASEQQKAYLFFNSLMEKRILVSLQTPYAFFTEMAIENITSKQNEDNEQITDFSITLKKIRKASTQTVAFDASKYQGRLKQQASNVVNKGKANGDKQLESVLFNISGKIGDKLGL